VLGAGRGAAGIPGRLGRKGRAKRTAGRSETRPGAGADELAFTPSEQAVAPVIAPPPVPSSPAPTPGTLGGSRQSASAKSGAAFDPFDTLDPAFDLVDASLETRRVNTRWEAEHQRLEPADDHGAVQRDAEQLWAVATPGGPVVANPSIAEPEPGHPRPSLPGATPG
jgi:hypothetical protein